MSKTVSVYNFIVENKMNMFTYQDLHESLNENKIIVDDSDLKDYLERLCDSKMLDYYCGEFFSRTFIAQSKNSRQPV